MFGLFSLFIPATKKIIFTEKLADLFFFLFAISF